MPQMQRTIGLQGSYATPGGPALLHSVRFAKGKLRSVKACCF